MTVAAQMFRTYPKNLRQVDREALADRIEACAQSSTPCAAACPSEELFIELTKYTRANPDWADHLRHHRPHPVSTRWRRRVLHPNSSGTVPRRMRELRQRVRQARDARHCTACSAVCRRCEAARAALLETL